MGFSSLFSAVGSGPEVHPSPVSSTTLMVAPRYLSVNCSSCCRFAG